MQDRERVANVNLDGDFQGSICSRKNSRAKIERGIENPVGHAQGLPKGCAGDRRAILIKEGEPKKPSSGYWITGLAQASLISKRRRLRDRCGAEGSNAKDQGQDV
jgi:hypothetical protein